VRCPAGSWIVKWNMRTGALVDQLQGVCSNGHVLRACGGNGGGRRSPVSDHDSRVSIRTGSLVDRFEHQGGNGGRGHTMQCGSGYRANGYKFRCGSLVDKVQLHCRLASTLDAEKRAEDARVKRAHLAALAAKAAAAAKKRLADAAAAAKKAAEKAARAAAAAAKKRRDDAAAAAAAKKAAQEKARAAAAAAKKAAEEKARAAAAAAAKKAAEEKARAEAAAAAKKAAEEKARAAAAAAAKKAAEEKAAREKAEAEEAAKLKAERAAREKAAAEREAAAAKAEQAARQKAAEEAAAAKKEAERVAKEKAEKAAQKQKLIKEQAAMHSEELMFMNHEAKLKQGVQVALEEFKTHEAQLFDQFGLDPAHLDADFEALGLMEDATLEATLKLNEGLNLDPMGEINAIAESEMDCLKCTELKVDAAITAGKMPNMHNIHNQCKDEKKCA